MKRFLCCEFLNIVIKCVLWKAGEHRNDTIFSKDEQLLTYAGDINIIGNIKRDVTVAAKKRQINGDMQCIKIDNYTFKIKEFLTSLLTLAKWSRPYVL